MHVHVITPLTTNGFRPSGALDCYAPADTLISNATLSAGPASVESAVDEVLAAPGVVDAALRAAADGADAVVIDCMLDPGMEAAREAVDIPVIGCGEEAFRAAADIGPFTVVTVLERQARAFRGLARLYGVGNRLRNVRGISVPVLELERDPDATLAETIRASRLAVQEDGAAAVVFGCTGMLGLGRRVGEVFGDALRVIDPLPHALEAAAQAARARLAKDFDRYPRPERKTIAGFEGLRNLHAAINPDGAQ